MKTTTTTTREKRCMDIFEATARRIMKQHDITTREALVSAMQQVGYARFAAVRTADKIFEPKLTVHEAVDLYW